MKTIIFSIAILLSSVAGSAQPILTAASSNPVPGDGYIRNTCVTLGGNGGEPGTGVIWDYTYLNTFETDTVEYAACGAIVDCSLSPAANIGAVWKHDAFVWIYGAYPDSFAKVGSMAYGNPSSSEGCDNARQLIRFPLTHGNVFFDSFKNDRFSGSISGADTTVCDGYGTLALPGVVYPNALRLYTRTTRYDTTWLFTGPGVPHGASREYQFTWYAPGFHFPLLQIVYRTAMGDTLTEPKSIYYCQPFSPTLINTAAKPITDVSIFPNPSSDNLHIVVPENEGVVPVLVMDFTGRQIAQWEIPIHAGGHFSCEHGLESGIYFLHIHTSKGIVVRKLVVQ
jgi:hypothetical protein